MESNSYGAFRSHIIRRGDRIDRVENPIVPGMFDVNCVLRPGVEFWMEVKSPKEPLRAATPLFGSNHPVSQNQINWAQRHLQAGGLGFFWVDTDLTRILVDAKHAGVLNEMSTQEMIRLATWASMKPTDAGAWEILRARIINAGKELWTSHS